MFLAARGAVRPVVACGHPRPHQSASVYRAFGRVSLRLLPRWASCDRL